MTIQTRTSMRSLASAALLAMATSALVALPASAAGNTLTVCASGCDFTTLSAAVSAATAGDTIEMGPGVYTAGASVTKALVIEGAGSGADPLTSTIIQGSGSGTGLTLSTSTGVIQVRGVRVTNFASGISAGLNVSLEDVASSGNANYGISLTNGATNLTITNSEFNQNGAGMKIGSTASASHITITGSHFDDNRSQGWYSDKNANGVPVLEHVTITDSTFNNNPDKGFYTERLSYATFTNVQFNNSGNGRATQGAGLDLNLKYGAYSEIWLEGIQAVDSGKIGSTVNGSGISIAARNDGSYASNPATLELVTLLDAQVSGATMGIYLGGDITSSVTIRRSSLSGNALAVVNETPSEADAVQNWWGTSTPAFEALVAGDVLVAPWYADPAKSSLATSPTPGDPVVSIPAEGAVTVVIPEDVAEPILDVSALVTEGVMVVQDGMSVATAGGITLDLAPGTTVIPSVGDWDAQFIAPTVVAIDSVTTPRGLEGEVLIAVKVGSDDVSFTLDRAARLVLPGAGGKEAGFVAPGGAFTAITAQCAADSQDAGDAAERDCYITVGDDLVIWTKHFTTFMAYSSILSSTGADLTPLGIAGLLFALGVAFLVARRRLV